jgi:TP901 family phage tail tape measure protein
MAGNIRQDEVQLRVVIDGSPARKELAQLAQESVKLQDELKGMKKGSAEATQALERLATIGKRQDELRKELGLTGLSLKELRGLAAKLEAQLKTMVPGSEQWQKVNAELQEVKVRIAAVGSAAGQQAAQWEVLRKELKLTDMTMQQLNQEQKRLKQLLDTTNPNTAEWRAYTQELQRVQAQQTQLNQQMTGGQKLWGSIKSNITGTVGAMVGVATVVYGVIRIFGDAVATIKEFDKGLSRIKALGGEYEASIKALGEAARTAGTEFGISAMEGLQAIEALAKAGVSAGDIMAGGLRGSLTLAAAGQLEVGEASEIAAKAMTQFGLSGKDIPRLADLLAASAGKATGEVQDIGQALSQAGLVANQFGLSVEETIGTLTAFASAGLLGSDAGTSLRTMLLRLANPSTEAAEAMKRMGIAAYDAEGQFVGLESLAGQLKSNLQDLTQAERDKTLATIFGSDAIRAANVLYSQGAQGVAEYTEKVNELGYAQEVARKQTDNWAGDLDKASTAWNNFVLSIDKGAGPISGVMRWLTQKFTTLVENIDYLNAASGRENTIKDRAEELKAKYNSVGTKVAFEDEDVTKLARQLKYIEDLANTNSETDRLFLGYELEKINKEIQRFATDSRPAARGLYYMNMALKEQTQALKDRAEEQAAIAAAADSSAGVGTGGVVPDPEVVKEKVKVVVDGMVALRDQLAAIRADMYRDALSADEADIAKLDEKYTKLRTAILAEETHTAEDLKALDELYANERTSLIEAQGQKRLTAYDQLQQEATRKRQEAEERLYQQGLSPEDQEVSRTLQEFDAEALNFQEGSEGMIRLRETYEAKLYAIGQKYRKLEADADAQARLQKIQNFTDTAQAVGSAVSGLQSILAASAAASGRSAAEQAEFQRSLALTQIGIATAVSIANALKNINEPFPANLIAITTSIGAVMAGIGQAMGVLNATPPTPAAPGSGGATLNNVPLGADGMELPGPGHDRGGLKVYDPLQRRVVAEVEGGELLMSKRFTEANRGILPQLLAASKAGSRLNFINSPLSPVNTGAVRNAMQVAYMATGGLMNSSSRGTALVNATAPGSGGSTYVFKKGKGGLTDDGGGTPPWAMAMLQELRGVRQATERIPTTLNAEVVLNPKKDRTEARYANVKARNTYRRSA